MKKNTKRYSSSVNTGGEAAILSNPGVLTTSFGTPRPRTNNAGLTLPAPRESGSPPDSFSSGGPVNFCTCNLLIAYDDAGSLVDPDCDPQEYFWQCPLHKMEINEHLIWKTLSSLMWNRRILTPEGIKLLRLLIKASDKRNPNIPLLESVQKEIDKTEEDIKWAALAKEKRDEWHQKDQESRASTGQGIPYPDWLRKYETITEWKLQDKRNKLSRQKHDLRIAISNFRFEDNYNYNSGGN